MYYNPAFDIVAFLIIIGIVTADTLLTNQTRRRSNSFIASLILLGISIIFDILAILTGGDILCDSDELNIIFETAYMCTGLFCMYAVYLTYASKVDRYHHRSRQFIFSLVSIYTFLLLINIPTKLLFDIVDGGYVLNMLFYVAYTIPVFIMLHTMIVLIMSRKKMDRGLFTTMLIASILPILSVLIQLIDDRQVMIQFGLSLTLLILNFIWETPDSKSLRDTVNALEQSKQDEEESRIQIEMAERAKTQLIDSLSMELLQPVTEIQKNATAISVKHESDVIDTDAEEIIKACNQFKNLLTELTHE